MKLSEWCLICEIETSVLPCDFVMKRFSDYENGNVRKEEIYLV